MTQAARSGKQNIAEGCSVGKTNPKSEHHLLNIARSSLKELLEDYQDFLRQRSLSQWDKVDPRAKAVRQLAYKSDKTYKSYTSYRSYIDDSEQAANVMITLINQTTYLLDQQIKAVEKQMSDKGLSYETQPQRWAKRESQRQQEKDFLKQLRDKYGPPGQSQQSWYDVYVL